MEDEDTNKNTIKISISDTSKITFSEGELVIELRKNVSDDSLLLCSQLQTIKRLSPKVWMRKTKAEFESFTKEKLKKARKNNYIAQRYENDSEFRDYQSGYSKKYYKKNRDDLIEKQKIHNTKNQESIKEYQKQHYQQNRDKLKEYSNEYYEKNKPRYKKYMRKYYKDHKENDNGY